MVHDLHDDPMSCAMDDHDIFDCITTMLQQEEQYLCHDYLSDEVPPVAAMHHTKEDAIDDTCRSKMCEWIFHVIDSTRLQRETASVAMNFLDRFLCTNSPRAEQARLDRREYQLAGESTHAILYRLNTFLDPFINILF